MRKLFCLVLSVLFLSSMAFAAAPEKVTIKPFTKTPKKAEVTFNHKEHSADTTKVACEECHHKKKKGETAEVTKCVDAECHAKIQEQEKDEGGVKVKVKYDVNSAKKDNPYHVNCLEGCHKKNKDNKKVPIKCEGCHPKAAGEKEE